MRPLVTKFFLLAIILGSTICWAKGNRISFPGNNSLLFSSFPTDDEKNTFGSGWKIATYKNKNGESWDLFKSDALTPIGGVLFDDAYPPEVSPSGKYATFLIQRVGVVDPGPSGQAEAQSREYCPVLETSTGCILSNQTGEVCGGAWSNHGDRWMIHGMTEDVSASMLHYQFSDANSIWKKFSSADHKVAGNFIQSLVSESLGIENLLACAPPDENNIESYGKIAAEFKSIGNIHDAQIIINKIKNFIDNKHN
ncbi:hypothetical protein [Pandoraea bronchicola]|uniref:Uncharacterized protein n=1 Tax=Pandoraea bronchicola TaxID=2508287 RepID=A0A5E5BSR7_9BURK|nr:hypothetical protein [Pandoraea bronchicola]VVE88357.1 hypothetical protein PBR20603_02306 [Pandoraea bronchicola]